VGVVHGLEGDTGVIAVEIAVLHEVLDGIDDLETELEGLEDWRIMQETDLLQQVSLFETCFQHCEPRISIFLGMGRSACGVVVKVSYS
jgi:hypothetical protein